MDNTGREWLRSGGVSNHAPLKADSDIKSACGKEKYSPQQLDGWIIHLCSMKMSWGVRRSWLITPLALGLVTTFPQLFICKTWRCFGFSFIDWCALCTCLNLDLQKLRSWMLSLHSWRFNEILEKKTCFLGQQSNPGWICDWSIVTLHRCGQMCLQCTSHELINPDRQASAFFMWR